MIDKISLAEQHVAVAKAAATAVADCRAEISELLAQVNAAKEKAELLRNDDSRNLAEVGHEIAVQNQIAEVGELRISRLKERLVKALEDQDTKDRWADSSVREIFSHLGTYRLHKKVEEISAWAQSWLIPPTDGFEAEELRKTLYGLACRAIGGSSNASAIADTADRLSYLLANREEVESALKHRLAWEEYCSRPGYSDYELGQTVNNPHRLIKLTPDE